MRTIFTLACYVVFVAVLTVQQAYAQDAPPGRIASNGSPDKVLLELIAQVQTGTPDASLIGPQLWQIIAAQTGNSGIYPLLVQLGRVKSVDVIAQRDLPAGPIYSLKATHTGGESHWLLGISNVSRKIEYASFGVNSPSAPILPPQPDPTKPSSTSKACLQFPNLCP